MATDYGIYLLFALLVIFIILGRREWVNHLRNLKSVPIRIIVNGTRGKSSVTRLIGAGLKAGGYKVLAKTTGTKPILIINNLLELPIIRLGKANIREQISIFKRTSKEGIDAIVLENMSLRPDLQWTEETKIVQPTVVVITNVRADHLDVMGPTLSDIAQNFINAIPMGTKVITAEKEFYPQMKKISEIKGISIVQSTEESIEEEKMRNFPYFEHRENVALAIEVCKHFGIEKEKALKELYKCIPDPGVLRKYDLVINNKKVTLYNALAANDPDSTYLIYERMEKSTPHIYLLINCRSDRIDRSLQMADLISKKIPAKLYFLVGGNTDVLKRRAISLGSKQEKIIDLGGKGVDVVFKEVGVKIDDNSTIFAMGNIVGYGEQLIEYFKAKGTHDSA